MWRIGSARLWRRLPRWARRALLWCLNAHFLVGALAVIRDGGGGTLVARHTYLARRPWALPGGWVRRNEDPADTVVRELFEETGLRVRVLALLAVQRENPTHLTVVYAASIVEGTFRASAEVAEVRFVRPGAYPEGLREDHRALIEACADHPAFRT